MAASTPGAQATPTAGSAPQAEVRQAPTLTFDFANPGLTPSAYRIEINADGTGHYHSQPGEGSAPDAQGLVATPFDQAIRISAPVYSQLVAIARARHFFTGACESTHKVAFTGRKTVAYAGPDGQGACTYNWSPDPRLMKLSDTFLAISLTLEEGRKLRLEYLHSRLSLDAELEALTGFVKSGNAIELQNIAPELRSIAEDDAVMKRAQARAAALLLTLPPGETSAAVAPH